MRRSTIFATLTLALPLAMLGGQGAFANDQLYKCVDPNGALMLSDKPCAVVQSVAADTTTAPATLPADVAAVPTDIDAAAEEPPRPVVVKERYTLPPAEFDRSQWNRKSPTSTAPKIDVATLKAAKLNLELSEKTASR
ncbi:hypothetical protein ACFFTM_05955 [Pseudoduganella plicata]|uniref:DUF4124 domain-containing protein n=1 Tax=Pseudoduganella plicata TaxID=321984 RepID=A0A4P7BLJ9_9BURK|nr:hypothetical protein [Pseudoduganella plicata]QBQ38605.1 hypothetical protein E1742_22345 [Pseudoduganella plicata]GGY83522.1 hypothetical protein GCM10007388_15690 [Pseudoduganella plicata]